MRAPRYSQLYVERGHRTNDSTRARRRLGLYMGQEDSFAGALVKRLGTEFGYEDSGPLYTDMLKRFFSKVELSELLDGITVIYEAYSDHQRHKAIPWHDFVARVFEEENLSYRIDPTGVVHPFVDQEFEVNRAAALDALGEARFGETRQDFEAAFKHLRDGEGKAAIRSMFPAIETAAKILFPGKFPRLMPNEVEQYFIPRLQQVYAGNQPATDAGKQLLQGMKAWIVSAQPYRHGQEVEEPAEPPVAFVIAFLSAGAVYLRWLIEICSPE